MVKEEKKFKREMWPKFSPWEHINYKQYTYHYFKIVEGDSIMSD
jgi:hypothetical protein